MGERITALIERIRQEQGPFFVARLSLRVKVPISKPDVPDTEQNERDIVEACRALGYDPRPGSR